MSVDHLPEVVGHVTVKPLAGSVQDLYRVYLEIAKTDHACRRAALYGKQTPPPGHTPFRPLSLQDFEHRFRAAMSLPQGEEIFRKQLRRQADVYGVSVHASTARQAA